MKSLISLELRKQSKSFIGLLFIICFSITILNAIVSHIGRLPVGEAFLLIIVVLQAVGLPFFALLLGAGAGAALRSPVREAEEDIPIRPRKRVFTAYIASLGYLFLLATILFVLSAPIKYSAFLQEDFNVPLIMIVLLPLHSAAFIFSYWLSMALLGSTVSAIITFVPVYIFSPYWSFDRINFGSVSLNAIPGVITVCIHLLLMLWLANRIERVKRTWLPVKIATATILASSLFLSVVATFFIIAFSDDIFRHEFKKESTNCCCTHK